jgi:hypothetical protein
MGGADRPRAVRGGHGGGLSRPLRRLIDLTFLLT